MPWWWVFITINLVSGDIQNYNLDDDDTPNKTTEERSNEKVQNVLNNNCEDDFLSKIGVQADKQNDIEHSFYKWKTNDLSKKRDYKIREEPNKLFINNENSNSGNQVKLTPDISDYINDDTTVEIQDKNQLMSPNLEEKNYLEKIKREEKQINFFDPLLIPNKAKTITLEQSKKRYPAFNSWAGKRGSYLNSWENKRSSAFNSWGGKRAAAFNSWGGKRDSAFNSWGGKRDAAFNSWGGKRDAAFNSWGGKRESAFNSLGNKKSAAFNSWGGKRGAAFNSWGGKRGSAFNSWGGKRGSAFNSWGGKRSAAFNSWGGKRISLKNCHNMILNLSKCEPAGMIKLLRQVCDIWNGLSENKQFPLDTLVEQELAGRWGMNGLKDSTDCLFEGETSLPPLEVNNP